MKYSANCNLYHNAVDRLIREDLHILVGRNLETTSEDYLMRIIIEVIIFQDEIRQLRRLLSKI